MKLYILKQLKKLKRFVTDILKEVRMASQQLKDLQAEVARNTEVTASAVALIRGLAAKIEELKDDPVALQELANQLKAKDDELAAAVSENTPSEPG